MRPHELAAGIDRILSRSPALSGKLAGVFLVANPTAGGFTRPSFARRRHRELQSLLDRAIELPPRADGVPLSVALTDRQGHAAELTRAYIAAALNAPARGRTAPEALHILMAAGGDGTSLELVSSLMELEPAARSRFLVLRLPFGTGNDGAEGRGLDSSLGRLLGPCRPAPRPALLCSPSPGGGKAPLWAFNIASFGLDAFVANLTNSLKSRFPGDSYKLMVDIATVFYDRLYRVLPMGLSAADAAGRPVRDYRRTCLLLAIGASGRRQYGSDKRILPDDDNVCAIFETGLLNKLAWKARIERGMHRGLPIVDLFSASRLVVEYGERVLFQADGEVLELGAADFPFAVKLMPDSYNVLAPEGS